MSGASVALSSPALEGSIWGAQELLTGELPGMLVFTYEMRVYGISGFSGLLGFVRSIECICRRYGAAGKVDEVF